MRTLETSNPAPAPAGHGRSARQLWLAAAWRGRSTFSGMPHCRSPLDADPTPAGQGRSAGQPWLRGWRRPGTARIAPSSVCPAAATLTLTRALTLPQQGEDIAQVGDACAAGGCLVLQEGLLRARRRCAHHADTLKQAPCRHGPSGQGCVMHCPSRRTPTKLPIQW